MESQMTPPQKISFSSLIGGIITDAKDLFTQELTLAKLEVRDELRQTKAAAISFVIGFSIITMGGVLLLLMLVHILYDFTTLSLWTCYGIIGGICLLIGGIFLKVGSRAAKQIDLVPEQTMQTLKDNAEWLAAKATNSSSTARGTL